MVEQTKSEITEQEAELYDRQIRLWGLDAQKRLRAARLCVIGVGGLGCEVAKNLVLAGVKSLKLVDDATLNQEDATSQFLGPRDKVGSNRAEVSLERLQQLNPMVEVSAEAGSTTDKGLDFFKQFDVVIATSLPRDELVRINSLCRPENILFYAGDVFGFFGWSFMDLVMHNYAEEVTSQQAEDATQDTDSQPPAKKAKQDADPETKTVKKAMAFKSFAETLKVDWKSELYAKRVKRMDPSYFLLQVLFAFQAETGLRRPRASHKVEDLGKLVSLRDSTLASLEVPLEKIPDSSLSLLFSQLSPVAAIVGGVLSQEVIKAISNKDAPHNNYFFYNPVDSCGVVETIGY